MKKEIREILENILYWDTCPDDYKVAIRKELASHVALDNVSERFMLIEQAATYLDALPSSQAIQQIKSLLTMKPATSVIDGDVILVMRNEH